ncbi:hypothetical protein M0R45_011421 [Rubus argutus]|uniref:Uncharacterized protein n=1 Tax=Rubus argutus TaxID=59490 RepID=A0AAW1Y9U5_RUBAR
MAADKAMKKNCPKIASVIPAKRRSVKRMIFDDVVKSVASLLVLCCCSPSPSNTNAKKTDSVLFPDPSHS